MSIILPLDNMTLADKLEAMETLWADILRRPADRPSPEWHKNILDERQRLVAEGKLRFLDWDTAMTDLRKELRENLLLETAKDVAVHSATRAAAQNSFSCTLDIRTTKR